MADRENPERAAERAAFLETMSRTLDGIENPRSNSRPATTQSSGEPESLLPPGFNDPVRPLVGRETPEGRASDVRAASADPASSVARNIRDITQAIPGDVMGTQTEFNRRVAEGHFSPEQHERFAAGGSALRNAINQNVNLARALHMSTQDPNGMLDLHDDGVDETDYAAWAVVAEEMRTFAGNKPTFEQIARNLGTYPNLERARAIHAALENPALSPDVDGHPNPLPTNPAMPEATARDPRAK